MACYNLRSEKLHETTPMCLVPWPACFMSSSQSSHFSLLLLFNHLGYINGEMGEEPQQLFGKLSLKKSKLPSPERSGKI